MKEKTKKISLAVLLVFLGIVVVASVVVLYRVTAFALNVCGEKGNSAPRITQSYSALSFAKDDVDSGELARMIRSLEKAEDQEKNSTFVEWIDKEAELAFLRVEQEHDCRQQGENTLYRPSFNALLFGGEIFPITRIGNEDYPDLSAAQWEGLADYLHGSELDVDDQTSSRNFDAVFGTYVFYAGDAKGENLCGALTLPLAMRGHCAFALAGDVYPEYERYAPTLIEYLSTNSGDSIGIEACGAFSGWRIPGMSHRENDAQMACAMVVAQETGDPLGCLEFLPFSLEDDAEPRAECLVRSGAALNADYCASLPRGEQNATRSAQTFCYRALAWQEGDAAYCDDIPTDNYDSTDFIVERCKEEVAKGQ